MLVSRLQDRNCSRRVRAEDHAVNRFLLTCLFRGRFLWAVALPTGSPLISDDPLDPRVSTLIARLPDSKRSRSVRAGCHAADLLLLTCLTRGRFLWSTGLTNTFPIQEWSRPDGSC